MRQPVIAVLLVVVVACGEDGAPVSTGTVPRVTDQSDDASEPSAPPLTATPLTASTSPTTSPSGTVSPEVAASEPIRAAVADLAGREGVDPATIEVLEVREVTWSDGSLGCPQPGLSYTQALVNGQLVVLAVGGRRFEYHGGGGRPLFHCADPRPPVDSGGSGAGDN